MKFAFMALFALVLPAVIDGAEPVDFNRDVRPILSDNCFACHGLDEHERKADLRLDTLEGATADLGGYHAVVPGSIEESEVWARINSKDKDEVMPPPKSHKKLKPRQIAILKRWIEEGAPYAGHWSFENPEKPDVPPLAGGRNEVDAFLRARLEKEGMSTSMGASKETLIRRVTLDLTGLPPTPEEVEGFLADRSPDAYEKLVDQLLGRVTYGEHMARYWLDLARYADTHGLHLDNERSMWPYRDWVARAFNENVKFDDFTRWQLAGDLLDDPTREQLIASGFNRCNVTTSEGGSIKEEWVYRYAVDRTSTAVEVWMGLTAGCAVCHDHKFDPISAKEFYSMYAFFHSAADPPMDGNKNDTPPILRLLSDEDKTRLKVIAEEIAAVDKRVTEALGKIDYLDPATLDPLPAAEETVEVWFEDGFSEGAKVTSAGGELTFVSEDGGEVFSGDLALRRSASGLEQDVCQEFGEVTMPADGKLFVHCFLDPEDVPKAIMLQIRTKDWSHRAVWGEQAKIPYGKPKSPEKFMMGDLPATGKWVRLEIDAVKMGLKKGMKVSGYAFTQFDGTVYWDNLGVYSEFDMANNPRWSYSKWRTENQGKNVKELPDELRLLVRGKKPEELSGKQEARVRGFWIENIYEGSREVLATIEAEKVPLEKEKVDIEREAPLTMVMADLPEPRESFVMERGAYDAPGEKVSRGVPAFLPGLPGKPEGRDYNRLDFAEWLVNGEHPLTARVTVNRFWQQFFGTGLVKTSADFGSQGEPPSHPELLDWLAVHFVETNWDVKELVRLLVTSSAYRQSSVVTPDHLERDPGNRLLARAPRLRLEAEVLRDQALFVSGLLVEKIGGKGVNPYQPPNIWEPVAFGRSNTRYYEQATGDDLYRRSLYTFLKRTAPPPFMSTFDAPNREQSCTARGRSNTPLQALQLMNDIQHVEAARNFAGRMIDEGGVNAKERIGWAWRVATARNPENDELDVAMTAFGSFQQRFRKDRQSAIELVSYGESSVDDALDFSELAAYTMVANLILNLDETVTKN